MYHLLKQTIYDFRHTYQKHLMVELIYKVMTSFLFMPVFAFLFDRILRIIGTGSLLNREVYKIGFSLSSLALLTVICLFCVMIIFVEFSTIIVIAQKRYFKRDIMIIDAFLTVLRKMPKLLGIGILPLFLFILLLMPFIASPLIRPLLDSFNVSILITNRLYDSKLFLIAYIAILLLIIYFILRWLFTLHYIIINDKSIINAMRSSLKLTKKNRIKILLYLFILNVVVFTFGFTIMYILSFLPSVLETNMFKFIIHKYLITFSSFMTLIISMIAIPVNIIFLTRLFYKFQENELVADHLMAIETKTLKKIEHNMLNLSHTKKGLLFIIIAIYFTSMFILNYTVNDNVVYVKWHTAIVGHRGDIHSAPENTISSIRAAIDKGVDVVEIDVQMTKDNVIVLHHDSDLTRVAGVPYEVSDLTYLELVQFDIGSRYSEQFAGETIPTLEEVFQETEGEVKLLIEIKPHDSYTQIVDRVVDLIELYEMEDHIYIQSFDNKILQKVREVNPELKIGQILFLKAGNLATLDVDFYSINLKLLSDRFMKNAYLNDREVWVWTVNTERDLKAVLQYDIDGIITNYPERVQRIIGFDF